MKRAAAVALAALAALLFFLLRPPAPAPIDPAARPAPPAPPRRAERAPDRPPPLDIDRFEALAAAADEPAPEPPDDVAGGVVCRVAQRTTEQRGVANLAGPYGIYGHTIAWAAGRELHLGVHHPVGEVYVHLTGYQPVQIDVVPGPDGPRCDPDPIRLVPGEAFVSGVVRNAFGAGQGRVWVEGCGAHAVTDADGAYELSVLPGACEVRAFRQDGVFTARGEAVIVQAEPRMDLDLDLVVPEFRTAGLGARVEETDRGILLRSVIAGGGAHASGLQDGDLVLSIDGEATVDLPLGDFVDRALGEDGTDVELLVLRGDEELEVTVRRRTMGG
jgi:hypothetical protein